MSALDELLPASFRGVSFHVEDEEPEQGRSVPIHEFAGSDDWSTEDHGLKHLQVRVIAYVADMGGVRAQSYALWGACLSVPSPALLVLPHAPSLVAWCTECRRSHRRDKLGYVAFTLTFVQAASTSLGVSPLLLPAQAALAALTLVGSLGALLAGAPIDAVRAGAAFTQTAAALGTAIAARVAGSPDADVVAAASGAVIALASVSSADPARGAVIAAAFASVVDALRVSSDRAAPQLLVDAAAALSAADLARAPDRPPITTDDAIVLPAASPVGLAPRAQSRILAAAATAAVRDTLRALAAVAYARRVMSADYATRDAAATARAELAALFGPLLDEAALDDVSFGSVSRVFGLASGHLIDVATSLKPIIRIETGKPLTACLLAWQIYGDTARAGELVARNAVATPCFMPTVIEAVAP